MSDDKIINTDELDELIQALEKSPETVLPLLEEAMTKSVRSVQARVTEYPPSTEANQPGRFSLKTHKPMGYYERGRGWWYPIMRPWTAEGQKFGKARGVIKSSTFVRKASSVQGYKLAGGGKSEMLGKSWTVSVTVGANAVIGEVGNNTSYAPWVKGDQQSRLHAARDWKPLDQDVEDSAEDINGFFKDALDEWLKSFQAGK